MERYWNHDFFLTEMFYHHRASAWGISIVGSKLITGSMDGTIGVIDLNRMELVRHFKAHDDEWGGNDFFLPRCGHYKVSE